MQPTLGMNLHRFALTCAITCLVAGAPSLLSAADVVDISSYNPHNANVVLRQIDLNVAITLYEKAQTGLQDISVARAEVESAMRGAPGAAEEASARIAGLEAKKQVLLEQEKKSRDQIHSLIEAANVDRSSFGAKAFDPEKIQGAWEGVETGRESEGKCTLNVNGDTLSLQTGNKQDWYKATFTLPAGTDPQQLRATITDCPAPEFDGRSALAIFKLEGGKLTLSGHPPGSADAPRSFEGDAEARTFVFRKVQP